MKSTPGCRRPVDKFKSDKVADFWSHMSRLCEASCPPRYADLDLMDLYQLAPDMTVLDVESEKVETETKRLRVRFAGTSVTDMFGRETTGLYMDEIDIGQFRQELLAKYAAVIRDAKPQWSMADVSFNIIKGNRPAQRRAFQYERLAFPLSDDDGKITHIAAVLVRHEASTTTDHFEARQLPLPNSGTTEEA